MSDDAETETFATMDDGTVCKVMRRFGDARAIVDIDGDGTFVMADRLPGGQLWTQSGEPARGEELAALKALLLPTNDKTVTKVTAPE